MVLQKKNIPGCVKDFENINFKKIKNISFEQTLFQVNDPISFDPTSLVFSFFHIFIKKIAHDAFLHLSNLITLNLDIYEPFIINLEHLNLLKDVKISIYRDHYEEQEKLVFQVRFLKIFLPNCMEKLVLTSDNPHTNRVANKFEFDSLNKLINLKFLLLSGFDEILFSRKNPFDCLINLKTLTLHGNRFKFDTPFKPKTIQIGPSTLERLTFDICTDNDYDICLLDNPKVHFSYLNCLKMLSFWQNTGETCTERFDIESFMNLSSLEHLYFLCFDCSGLLNKFTNLKKLNIKVIEFKRYDYEKLTNLETISLDLQRSLCKDDSILYKETADSLFLALKKLREIRIFSFGVFFEKYSLNRDNPNAD